MSQKCTGTSSKTGKPCRAWAVRGATVCIAHGGAARQVRDAAARRVAEAKVLRVIGPYVPPPNGHQPVNVWEQLYQLVGEVTWLKDQLGGLVGGMRADQWRYQGAAGEQLRAEVALYERALDRTSSLLIACGRLGVEEKLADAAQRNAEAIVTVLLRALDALGLGEELRRAASDAVYRVVCEFAGRDPGEDERQHQPPAWTPAPLGTPLTPVCEMGMHGQCARPEECQCTCHRRAAGELPAGT